MRIVSTLVLLSVLSAGCPSRSVGGDDAHDSSLGTDASAGDAGTVDAVAPTDAALVNDGSAPTCECPADQVYRHHSCVATLEVGCGPVCTGETDCPEGWRCETCGASTSCDTFDCRGTCVRDEYYQPLDAGELRIDPVSVPEGVESEITIVGHPWTIAAMFYLFEVGGTPASEVWQDSTSCTTTIRVPPLPAGRYPVRVSQYGGGPPWMIAGFLHYASPTAPCTQPYTFCDATTPCCSGTTPDETFSCVFAHCYPIPTL